MKMLIVALLTLSSAVALADHCSIESKVKYDENGIATFPASAGWAMGTRSMEYFKTAEECWEEALKWKSYIEADASAAPLISSLKVVYGDGKDQVSKELKVSSNHKVDE